MTVSIVASTERFLTILAKMCHTLTHADSALFYSKWAPCTWRLFIYVCSATQFEWVTQTHNEQCILSASNPVNRWVAHPYTHSAWVTHNEFCMHALLSSWERTLRVGLGAPLRYSELLSALLWAATLWSTPSWLPPYYELLLVTLNCFELPSRSKCIAHYELLMRYEYMGEQLID